MKRIKNSKTLKNVLSCTFLAIISLIFGYTIWIPGDKVGDNSNPIAVYLEQDNGSYLQASNTNMYQIGYTYNSSKSTCVNGSSIAFVPGTGVSINFVGSDSCQIYYDQRPADITITSITVDGTRKSKIPTRGNYTVTPTCSGANATWNYADWALDITSVTSASVSCSVELTSTTKTYLNNYIINNAGTIQGASSSSGQIVYEHLVTDKSSFVPTKTLEFNDYANVTNDTAFPYAWDDSANTWTSTNHSDSTISSITFKVNTSGTYQICYTQSSEVNYDYATFFVDNSSVGTSKGMSGSCINLGLLTTTNTIKVQYSKDSSVSNGNDNIVFYLQIGTYNEDITTENRGYRYEGSNPYNYVLFNNEIWRIIGVFETTLADGITKQNLTKIIRNDSIGAYVFNKTAKTYWVDTTGKRADLNILLNDYYYNKQNATGTEYCNYRTSTQKRNCDYTRIGLSENYKSMVENVTWYLSGHPTTSIGTSDIYEYERNGTNVSNNASSGTGFIGLMYPSDFGYSVLSSSCSRTKYLADYDTQSCGGKAWLLHSHEEWTITPRSERTDLVSTIGHNGAQLEGAFTHYNAEVRPTLYLKSNIIIIDGEGTPTNPFILGI